MVSDDQDYLSSSFDDISVETLMGPRHFCLGLLLSKIFRQSMQDLALVASFVQVVQVLFQVHGVEASLESEFLLISGWMSLIMIVKMP